MSTGFLDTLVQTYIHAFQQGFAILHVFSLGLLGLVGSIAWGANFIMVIQAGLPMGAILAQLVLVLMSLAIHVLLIQNMYSWAFGLFDLFVGWGAAVTGGQFTAAQFLSPSTFWTMGFTISRPLIDFVMGMGALSVLKNIGPIVLALVAVIVIVGAFLWVSKDIIITILEFHLAVAIAPVLFPWAILAQTAEFAAFVISWLMAGALRALLIVATVGIGVPLMAELIPTFTAGGDPTIYSSLVMVGSALLFMILVNEVAKRAAVVGGRGYALGLPGAALVPPSVVSAGATLLSGGASYVAAGVSAAIRARRGR